LNIQFINAENTQELRWVLRLNNFEKALIHAFEFTHQLAWNVMKDYFNYQGTQDITGSRDTTCETYSKGLVQNGEGWLAMIQSRNKTSHTYNQWVANEIVDAIKDSYFSLFREFLHKFLTLKTSLA